METPVLSKKQMKSTLSAKKNRPKETIKNVLAMPYNNNYWPEISSEDQAELQEVLKSNLPRFLNEVKIPWNELKEIPKVERKAYRTEYAQKMIGPQPNKDKRFIVGINEVSKALEKNSVRTVLISAEVQPRLLVQHILDQAVLNQVPVLCVVQLNKIMRSITGIGTICFGIDMDIPADSKLNLIIEKIERIFESIPPPENHINYNRSIDSFKAQKEMKEVEEVVQKKKVKVDEAKIRNEVYLKRTDKKTRAFIPQVEETQNKVSKMEVDDSGFVPFTDEPDLEQTTQNVKKSKAKHKYKSLVVKRLKGDKDRNQRKIQKLKQKREK